MRKLLVGRKISSISIVGGRYERKPFEGLSRFISENSNESFTIDSIDTKGKFMWWTIGRWKLWCTYGMSGQWSAKRLSHVAVEVDLDDGTSVFFCDQRRFGTLKFVDDRREHTKKLNSLGPDVLGAELTSEIFAENLLVRPDRPVCEALMDQACVSGIGNYIRAEAMWLAKVDPWKAVGDMTARQLLDLYESATSVAKNSYESGGATIHTYAGVDGERGKFSSRFVVYGRKTDADDGDVFSKKDSNGRTVHWSPERQK